MTSSATSPTAPPGALRAASGGVHPHRAGSRLIIPSSLICAAVSDQAVRVYGWIAYRDAGPRGCFETVTQMSSRLGVSRATVHRALAELTGAWIYRTPTGYKARQLGPGDTYALVPPGALGQLTSKPASTPTTPPSQLAGGAAGEHQDTGLPARSLRAYAYVCWQTALGRDVTATGLAGVLRNKGTSGGRDRDAPRACSVDTARRVLADLVEWCWLTAQTRSGRPTRYVPQFSGLPARPRSSRTRTPARPQASTPASVPAAVPNPRQPCDTPQPTGPPGSGQPCDTDPPQQCAAGPRNGAPHKTDPRRGGLSEDASHRVVRNGAVGEGDGRDASPRKVDHGGGAGPAPGGCRHRQVTADPVAPAGSSDCLLCNTLHARQILAMRPPLPAPRPAPDGRSSLQDRLKAIIDVYDRPAPSGQPTGADRPNRFPAE